MESAITRFVFAGSGDGDGDGYGDGYGCGDGDGYGDGYGCGDGSGYGDGDGYGDGSGSGSGYGYGCGDGSGSSYGSGISSYNGSPVHVIDGTPTIITCVTGNIAKGHILFEDLTTLPCYVAKQDDVFAHSDTLRGAVDALRDKVIERMDTDNKIAQFKREFKRDVRYPAKRLYDWHHLLTGSCKAGRDAWVRNHGVKLDTDTYTTDEFIDLCKGEYGGDIIRRLLENIMKNGKVYKMEKLTREECEAQICKKILEICDIAAAYMGRTPTYMTASWIINDRNLCSVMFNNVYYGVDEDKPINMYRQIDREGEMVTDNA